MLLHLTAQKGAGCRLLTLRFRQVSVWALSRADRAGKDADHAPDSDPFFTADYEALEAVSVSEAVKWAESQPCPSPFTSTTLELASETRNIVQMGKCASTAKSSRSR